MKFLIIIFPEFLFNISYYLKYVNMKKNEAKNGSVCFSVAKLISDMMKIT